MSKTKRSRKVARRLIGIIYRLVASFCHWVLGLVYRGNGLILPPISDPILLDSATGIALKIRTKKLTSVKVLETFIERINEVNPLLNCVVANRFDEARIEAKAADDLINSGTIPVEQLALEKPFLGVPFTTKDCIPIKGLIHSSGLVKRKDVIAKEDAKVVARLRDAGAIPIGLTNVSELCMWWESSNKVHGRTNNPYNTNRIVGGSSGGEGCGQGAAVSAFGIGSDIGGSIRMPAFFNGVFGHKPSPGLVPNHGQYPEPVTEEQNRMLGLGPLCRKAVDLAPLLKVLSDSDGANLRLDEKVEMSKLRWFYQDTDTGADLVSPVQDEIKGLFTMISKYLRNTHRLKFTAVTYKRFVKSCPIWFANMKSPDGPAFREQLANHNGSINPWLELLKWTFGLSEHTFIAIMTCLVENDGIVYGDEKHKKLLRERDALRKELSDLLKDDGVFLYPTHPTSAPYHNEPIIKPLNFTYTAVINSLGLPATHCPIKLDKDGLPIGVQVIAAEGNDRLCIAVAREIESAFGGWVAPFPRF